MKLNQVEKLLIRGLLFFPLNEQEREAIFLTLNTNEERWALITFMQENRTATAQDIKNAVGAIIESTGKKLTE